MSRSSEFASLGDFEGSSAALTVFRGEADLYIGRLSHDEDKHCIVSGELLGRATTRLVLHVVDKLANSQAAAQMQRMLVRELCELERCSEGGAIEMSANSCDWSESYFQLRLNLAVSTSFSLPIYRQPSDRSYTLTAIDSLTVSLSLRHFVDMVVTHATTSVIEK
ncbi:hypothetical protein MRB53_037766 [Persea americana]|nr:hypothetical protein MRB53_037766 [Persea americana]